MRCPHCNREINDGAKFCEFCGAQLGGEAAAAVSTNETQQSSDESATARTLMQEAPAEPNPQVQVTPNSGQQTSEASAAKPKKSLAKGLFIGLIAIFISRCIGAAAGRSVANSMLSNDYTSSTTTTSSDLSDDQDSESDDWTIDELESDDTTIEEQEPESDDWTIDEQRSESDDWTIDEYGSSDTTTTDSDTVSTYADDATVTIDYPDYWVEVENDIGGVKATYHYDEETNGAAFIMEYVQDMSLDPQSQEAQTALIVHELGFERAFTDVEETLDEDFEIDGYPAKLVEFEGTQEGSRIHVERVIVMTPSGLTSFSAGSAADEFEQYRASLEAVLDTIHVR